MNFTKRHLVPTIAACCALFLLAGCAERKAADKGTIRLACGNWSEGIAVSQLLEALIGDMGYSVETTLADPAPIFTALADGHQDIFVETWLPVFHKAYFDKFSPKLEIIGTWFDAAKMGFVVPKYVEIESVEEMNDVSEAFNGKIFGIDAGSSTMDTAAEMVKQYNLDYELIASSEPAMIAALQDAIERDKWVVIIGWEPHTMFAHFDLKFLADPKDVFGAGEPEKIQATARKGFSVEYPEIAALFSKMTFNSAQIGSLMDVAVNSTPQNEKALIRQWISENQTLVDSWFIE